MKLKATILFILASASGFCFDTGFSNEQEGVRMKILGFAQKTPMLRIENQGRLTLAIRSDLRFTISVWDRTTLVLPLPPQAGAFSVQEESRREYITIIGPKTNIELPITFQCSTADSMRSWYGVSIPFPKGKHQVRMTTNCAGITALDRNVTPFRGNFYIPPFDFDF